MGSTLYLMELHFWAKGGCYHPPTNFTHRVITILLYRGLLVPLIDHRTLLEGWQNISVFIFRCFTFVHRSPQLSDGTPPSWIWPAVVDFKMSKFVSLILASIFASCKISIYPDMTFLGQYRPIPARLQFPIFVCPWRAHFRFKLGKEMVRNVQNWTVKNPSTAKKVADSISWLLMELPQNPLLFFSLGPLGFFSTGKVSPRRVSTVWELHVCVLLNI